MRIEARAGLSCLRYAYVLVSARLENLMEALDETPDHRRVVVDSAGWDSTPLRLAVDGRAVRLGAHSVRAYLSVLGPRMEGLCLFGIQYQKTSKEWMDSIYAVYYANNHHIMHPNINYQYVVHSPGIFVSFMETQDETVVF